MTREEKLQKAHQMFDNRNLLTELKWQREYFKRGYVSNQEELFNLWIFDECIKALEPTTKNDLGVTSELEKNSKKLEKNFGELDCILRADARGLICKIDRKYMFGMSGKAFQDLYKGIDNLPSVTPQEPILDKIRAEIKALSPEPTAYDVVDGNPVKDAIWETLIEVNKIIDKYKAESEELGEVEP